MRRTIYRCPRPECGSDLIQQLTLSQQVENLNHGGKNLIPLDNPEFKCVKCNAEFTQISNLIRHEVDIIYHCPDPDYDSKHIIEIMGNACTRNINTGITDSQLEDINPFYYVDCGKTFASRKELMQILFPCESLTPQPNPTSFFSLFCYGLHSFTKRGTP